MNFGNSYDQDKLTDNEREELGLDRKLPDPNAPLYYCKYCNKLITGKQKKVSNFQYFGIQILKKKEQAHKSCLDKFINNTIKKVTS